MGFLSKKALAVDFIRNYAETTKRGNSYKRVYRNIANKLACFSDSENLKVKSNTFDDSMAEKYIEFLESQGLRKNTIKNIWDKTKYMFRLMSKRGFDVNFSFEEVQATDEATTTAYLTIPEIEKMYNLKDLTEDNRLVVDLFVCGCCTGLRFSDYSKLTHENIVGNCIVRKTIKTGEIVHIPIHYLVRDILNRYGGFPPYKKSQQNFNARLKTLAKKAGLTDKLLVEYTKGGKVERELKAKYEMVSTHTARRSFATNAYLAGIPSFRIMLITGHKTESAFFKYIRIQKEENADLLSGHDFFTKKSTDNQ